MSRTFMIQSLRDHIATGIDTTTVFILGKKNAGFIADLNEEAKLFDQLVALEHPRYIQQYQSRQKHLYIEKYLWHLKAGV